MLTWTLRWLTMSSPVTDCLVDYPNYPAEINQTKVDYVCVVDQIGIPEKIATGAAKPTTDQRKILMAEYCTQVVANTPYFKDGFSYQTGVGGASIASFGRSGILRLQAFQPGKRLPPQQRHSRNRLVIHGLLCHIQKRL